jgi:transcription elongation factor S-II
MEPPRHSIVDTFKKYLNNDVKAANFEKACYNSVIRNAKKQKIICKWENKNFMLMYKNKIKSMLFNINKNNNAYLHDCIQKNKIKITDIPFLAYQELSPERWKEIVDLQIKKNKSKYEIDIEAATEEFTCYKCKNNKCTYYELQTRSADEPMTTFVTCLVCGNRWKC